MSISYYLRENPLSDDPLSFRAIVSPVRTVDISGVIERMVHRGTTPNASDILSVFEDFCAALPELLREGANVNTPFANFRSSIKGKFVGYEDKIDRSRHQVVPSLSAGKRLKDNYRNGITTNLV